MITTLLIHNVARYTLCTMSHIQDITQTQRSVFAAPRPLLGPAPTGNRTLNTTGSALPYYCFLQLAGATESLFVTGPHGNIDIRKTEEAHNTPHTNTIILCMARRAAVSIMAKGSIVA